MDKTQQAAQLRLAADLLETGHPWGFRQDKGPVTSYNSPLEVIQDGNVLIPLLATPPDGRPLHNPDNLTAEQVGAGYRLALVGEEISKEMQVYRFSGTWVAIPEQFCGTEIGKYSGRNVSVRLPLSIPWPESAKTELTPELKAKGYEQYGFGAGITVVEKPDPYAELKKAHAEGKVIQGCIRGHWIDCPHPTWKYPVNTYREKPEAPDVCAVPQIIKNPPLRLPPPPLGMQWHRTDGWQEGDLPQGWRPLVLNEQEQDVDQWAGLEVRSGMRYWYYNTSDDNARCLPHFYHRRTRRPLTFTHEGKTWTWHRSGDPMPCDGERIVYLLFSDGIPTRASSRATIWSWDNQGSTSTIIGWRYADENKTVPLGPEDVIKKMREFLDMIEGRCSKPA